jgi:hypothetical protein
MTLLRKTLLLLTLAAASASHAQDHNSWRGHIDGISGFTQSVCSS